MKKWIIAIIILIIIALACFMFFRHRPILPSEGNGIKLEYVIINSGDTNKTVELSDETEKI